VQSSQEYTQLLNEIAEIALKSGRDPNEIKLIAISKSYPWYHIEPVYKSGCRNFGENRLQEALEKKSEAPQDVLWHFIGPLQKNKVRKAIGQFVMIHSVDTPELAKKISECSLEANLKTRILLQVNTSGEKTKQGMSIEEWKSCFEFLLPLQGILIDGLMTMAPFLQDEKVIRRCFSQLRLFRDSLKELTGLSLPELSMGMSNDYPYAIKEGATLLRVGTKIFGT
jgi:pyridoxal phosphate enzyme (YggS family)